MDNYDYEHDDDFIDDDLPPLVESTSSSYIPRPPNAFILFRSAFIRSQRISGRVEGNHSTLSKIIGMYWRALTNEEKQEWEAKAKVALEEHRRRYPDWRFRPGVNGGRGRGRGGRGRRGRGRGGEGDGRGREKRGGDPERNGKILDLLVEGRPREDLERAVQEWDRERGRAGKRSRSVPSEKRPGKAANHARTQSSSTGYQALDFAAPAPVAPPQGDVIQSRQGVYSFTLDPSVYSPTEDAQSPWHTNPYQSSYTNPGSTHISSFSTLSGWAGDSDMQSPTTSAFGTTNVEQPREYSEMQTYDNFADASYNSWHEERHYSFDSNELHNPFSYASEFNQYQIPGPSSPGPPSSVPSPTSPFQVGSASTFSDLRFIDEGFRFSSSPPQEMEGEPLQVVPFQPVQVIDRKGKGKAYEEEDESVTEGYVNWN
ncbi:uncharacterized protein EV420DRAFT_1757106 [Desarmillaria tabescens]|uniref:HMG box domain-containing protein n=1 Tax=Armillaria tabescens TaxID=1929756 RepID=A0AA39TT22_ARMTA|nr:uncharacterized protein EV420DRAFT_1757106 [Desarmillaria tabescens]KAK0469317.1 hypothetical protein EV420DRAFT_1757106 [Desarmillaria tabescens]